MSLEHDVVRLEHDGHQRRILLNGKIVWEEGTGGRFYEDEIGRLQVEIERLTLERDDAREVHAEEVLRAAQAEAVVRAVGEFAEIDAELRKPTAEGTVSWTLVEKWNVARDKMLAAYRERA